MMLTTIPVFREKCFDPSVAPPTERTIALMIDRKEIPGGLRMGKKYFIDLDTFRKALTGEIKASSHEHKVAPAQTPAPVFTRKKHSRDSVVDEILSKSTGGSRP